MARAASSCMWRELRPRVARAASVSPLVTSENQNVVAVLTGYNKRSSGSLLTEAGLTNGHEIIQLVKKLAREAAAATTSGGASCPLPHWRVKSISLYMEEDSFLEDRVTKRLGTGGSLTQTLFFFTEALGLIPFHRRRVHGSGAQHGVTPGQKCGPLR